MRSNLMVEAAIFGDAVDPDFLAFPNCIPSQRSEAKPSRKD